VRTGRLSASPIYLTDLSGRDQDRVARTTMLISVNVLMLQIDRESEVGDEHLGRRASHLSQSHRPVCISLLSYISLEGTNLRDIREKYFAVSPVKELFQTIDNHTIIDLMIL